MATSPARKQVPADRSPGRQSRTRPAESRGSHQRPPPVVDHLLLQFKPVCACDGGCPACTGPIQTKLSLSLPGDEYELEADRVADRIMQMSDPRSQREPTGPYTDTPPIGDEQAEEMVSRDPVDPEITPVVQGRPETDTQDAGGAGDVASAVAGLRGRGQWLSPASRSFFEPRFGYDLSGVRLHTGREAAALASAVRARAFTIGRDIVFGSGQYRPATASGLHLLAHELTHVIQQTRAGTACEIQRTIGDGHDLSSPRFRREPTLEACYDNEDVLTIGDNGAAVERVQHALIDLGYKLPVYGIDGDYGSETQLAVWRFQQDRGLSRDGQVGTQTIGELDRLFPDLAGTPIPTGAWNEACVLQILCPWNRATVRELPSITVKECSRIAQDREVYDGTAWTSLTVNYDGYAHGVSGGREMGILTGMSCEDATAAVYHEWLHLNQPTSQTTTRERERYAYTYGEWWTIHRGLRGIPSLRMLDPSTGETVVNPAAVEAHVARYAGVSSTPGEEIIERVGSDQVRVRTASGAIMVRPARAGDTVPGATHIDVVRTVNPVVWVCP